jgi:hypothetical protein
MDKSEVKLTMSLKDYEELDNRAKFIDKLVQNVLEIEFVDESGNILLIDSNKFLKLMNNYNYLNDKNIGKIKLID